MFWHANHACNGQHISGASSEDINKIVEKAHNVALEAEKRICKIGGISNVINPSGKKLSVEIEGGKTIDFRVKKKNIVK